jgi:glycerol-3-phosphate acyltransferase PlsY
VTPYWLLPASYLVGSLPFGLWLVKAVKGVDIREVGSGNIGTTNVYRTAGLGLAVFVFLLDVLKGLAPVLSARALGAPAGLVIAVALLSVIGHSKSLFLKFKGGKSAATGIGTILALSWPAGLTTLGVWALLFALTRRVSVGSMGAALAVPALLFLFGAPPFYGIYGAIAAIYVIARHRANIQRLFSGEEQRL